MTDAICLFPAPGPDPITSDLDGWKKVEGNPAMKTRIQLTSADGSMISGTWEVTPGTYDATCNADEFVHLVEGQITMTPEVGQPVTVRPGDAFAVAAGFRGTRNVRGHVCIKLKSLRLQRAPAGAERWSLGPHAASGGARLA